MTASPGFNRKFNSFCPAFAGAVFTLISLFYSLTGKAQGDLFINPKRIVFEGQKRSQEISLANIGNDTAHYMISFIQIRMKDNGSFEQIEQPDSGQHFADKYLRVFPRAVTLAPKETQTIKIQIYQKDQLQPGEYRSHLYFRGAPGETPPAEDAKKTNSRNVSVKLTPVFGISIPVIIRIGEDNTRVSLTDAKLVKDEHAVFSVAIRVNRAGLMSVYGDLTVEYVSTSGKTIKAGAVKGLSVYTPNLLREVKIPLDDQKENYHTGKLRISYTSSANGRAEQLALTELILK